MAVPDDVASRLVSSRLNDTAGRIGEVPIAPLRTATDCDHVTAQRLYPHKNAVRTKVRAGPVQVSLSSPIAQRSRARWF